MHRVAQGPAQIEQHVNRVQSFETRDNIFCFGCFGCRQPRQVKVCRQIVTGLEDFALSHDVSIFVSVQMDAVARLARMSAAVDISICLSSILESDQNLLSLSQL